MAFNETDGWLGARTTLSLHVGLQQCWGFTTSQMVWVNMVRGSRRDEGIDGWMDGVNGVLLASYTVSKYSILHESGGKKGLNVSRT